MAEYCHNSCSDATCQ